MKIRCADCDCFPDDCRISSEATKCPNCTMDVCCCWKYYRAPE